MIPAEPNGESRAKGAGMGEAQRAVLTVNGGSSSIKFAIFGTSQDSRARPERIMGGAIEGIGLARTVLHAVEGRGESAQEYPISATSHKHAAEGLIEWLQSRLGRLPLAGVGHRVVHGGIRLVQHAVVTDELVAELRQAGPLDLAHLPREIALLEIFRRRFAHVPHVACFDTAFHQGLPQRAKLLPIPRRYFDAGIRRLGFHGLSYAYLMEELRRIAGTEAAEGRIILAHLGSGASMTAMRGEQPMDTTMAFTPTGGLMMGTRPGDFDPGLLAYLMRAEKMTPEAADRFINNQCGLLGVSGSSYDMRELLARRAGDVAAAEAVELFCYQAKKFIGAYAAALGGLDTLIFAGGIGEHVPEIRASICEGLEFLGIELDAPRNLRNEAVISAAGPRVMVRVIPTDEEIMMARIVLDLIAP